MAISRINSASIIRSLKRLFLWLLLFVLVITVWRFGSPVVSYWMLTSWPGNIQLTSSEEATRRSILQKLPIGTNIQKVREVMSANGFIFTPNDTEGFIQFREPVWPADEMQKVYFKPKHYLSCEKEAVGSRWRVALAYENNVLTEVRVAYHELGSF